MQKARGKLAWISGMSGGCMRDSVESEITGKDKISKKFSSPFTFLLVLNVFMLNKPGSSQAKPFDSSPARKDAREALLW
jgi:hypothetical protein